MSTLNDRVVVVTGASAGIGEALAFELAARGAKLALVARRADALEAVRAKIGERAIAIAADVTKREDHTRVVEQTIAAFGHVDAYVNNAGRGITRKASELGDADVDEMILVNVKSTLYGVQAVLPHFRSRGGGHVVNVSTLLGRVPLVPLRSAYAASKAAMNSLSASLRAELRPEKILVSVVYPGIVQTDFGLNALHGGPDNRALPGAQPVGEVAKVIADVIEHRKAESYTRPEQRGLIAAYYGAEDVGELETKPPYLR
jgi:NADP-dependent 3-hydroxy acid dehydrogenase YdfG